MTLWPLIVDVLWIALQVTILAALATVPVTAATLAVRHHRRRTALPTPSRKEWTVQVSNATAHRADYYDSYDGRNRQRVDGQIAVRVVRGADMMTIGTARITDDDFEETVTTLKAKADERAAALNAVWVS